MGQLPLGFTLNAQTGLISGVTNQTSTYNFTVKVVGGTCQATKAYTIVVNASMAALAQMADYDGDGKSDLALWSHGVWRIASGVNRQTQTQSWGAAGDLALLGDYDGDGASDLAVFRPGNGTWYILKSGRSSDDGYLVKAWGAASDVPVPGDYDGDGQTDFAVWRAGTWYVWQSASSSYRVTEWGANYAPYFDQAAPGNYDGDGQADVAVWRAADQTWYIRCSADDSAMAQAHGQAGDAPVSVR